MVLGGQLGVDRGGLLHGREIAQRGTSAHRQVQVYEEALGTITVERVLYAKEGVKVPSKIQLHSSQNVGLLCNAPGCLLNALIVCVLRSETNWA